VLFLHAVATMAVVLYTLRRAGETGGKPDPVTEARASKRSASKRRAAGRRDGAAGIAKSFSRRGILDIDGR
jgi:hypothetical protein